VGAWFGATTLDSTTRSIVTELHVGRRASGDLTLKTSRSTARMAPPRCSTDLRLHEARLSSASNCIGGTVAYATST